MRITLGSLPGVSSRAIRGLFRLDPERVKEFADFFFHIRIGDRGHNELVEPVPAADIAGMRNHLFPLHRKSESEFDGGLPFNMDVLDSAKVACRLAAELSRIATNSAKASFAGSGDTFVLVMRNVACSVTA